MGDWTVLCVYNSMGVCIAVCVRMRPKYGSGHCVSMHYVILIASPVVSIAPCTRNGDHSTV